MTLDYSALLRRAWTIIWTNKILWLFGIFSVLMGGQFGGPEGGSRVDFSNPRDALPAQLQNIDQGLAIALVLGLVAVILLIGLVCLILAVFARGGLIGGVRLADQQGKVSFGEAWAIGRKKFWTVLGIGLAVWALGLLLAGLSFASFLVCLAPLACIGVILLHLLGFYARLAQIVAVSDDVGVAEALTRAWRLITTNLGALLVLGLILIIVQAVINFVVLLPVALLAFPALLAYIGYANATPLAGGAGLALVGLCLVIYVPLLIVAVGVVESWITAVWTLTYKQLTGPALVAPAPLSA